jgi:hypothetical protein
MNYVNVDLLQHFCSSGTDKEVQKMLNKTPLIHVHTTESHIYNQWEQNYRTSRPIRRTFSPEKCDLNSTCVLCAKGKYYFQTYNTHTSIIQHLYHGMILVAVTMIFWVSVMNKYIMVDKFGM